MLALPLPHLLSPLPSPFLFSSALQLPTTIGKEERPVLNQHSTLPLIKYNKILLKMVSKACYHTQPSASARALVSDKGRVSRDRGITRVRRFKNPDNHQSCFMS